MPSKRMFLAPTFFLIILVAGTVGIFWWLAFTAKPNPVLPGSKVTIAGSVLSVEVANTTTTRARGLSGRAGLNPDSGMLFIFRSPTVQSFWMREMNFPIDIVWIRENKIIGYSENAVPEPEKQLWQLRIYRSPGPADRVLEVAAGTVSQKGWTVGTPVGFTP